VKGPGKESGLWTGSSKGGESDRNNVQLGGGGRRKQNINNRTISQRLRDFVGELSPRGCGSRQAARMRSDQPAEGELHREPADLVGSGERKKRSPQEAKNFGIL